MKILVNTSALTQPLSGVGRYTQELLTQLIQHPAIEDIAGFNLHSTQSKQQLQQLLENLNKPQTSQVISLNFKQKTQQLLKQQLKQIPGLRWLKMQLQNYQIKHSLKSYQKAIYWEPNYILSNFSGPSVPVIYDLSHIRFPQFHPVERLQWLENNLPDTLAKASHIITISEFSKQEIISVYGIQAKKISIISPAVSAQYRISYSRSERQKIAEKYQLPKNFILSVGNIEPRKNLMGLLKAYQQLPAQQQKNYPLVIIGANGWLTESIETKIKQLQKETRIIRLGYIKQSDMPLIYQSATLFIYISLYEGYGMPIAEAMVSGVPVITSNCSSMPSVANGSAKLVDPHNTDEISTTISKLLKDQKSQQQLIEKGIQQSKNYTWEKSAQQLIKLFIHQL